MTADLLLAIDQGTTSTRAVLFDTALRPVDSASRPLSIHHPQPGWVEQDPGEILDSVVETVAEVLARCGGTERVVSAGLDNQGETVIAWNEADGRAFAPAIVWQCKRSSPIVDRLRSAGLEPKIRERSGLPLDPYYSAGKMTWLLEELPEIRSARDEGRLRLGTVDAWLTSRLGVVAATDPSTASRTQLFSLNRLEWDPQLLEWFAVPPEALPTVVPSAGADLILRHARWHGELPLRAMLCDQQAALAGNAGLEAGAVKATYGTGVFVLANAGGRPLTVAGLETSVGWRLDDGESTFVLQGGVFTAGALVDWLCADLGIASTPTELDELALSVPDTAGVVMLPALAGIGAPWWRPDARAVIAGLTLAADRRHLARAALDAIAHRVCDVVEAVASALPGDVGVLRVDGGATASAYLLQRQSDLLGVPIEVASTSEATALGVAAFAGLAAGVIDLETLRGAAAPSRRIEPTVSELTRRTEREAWRRFLEVAQKL